MSCLTHPTLVLLALCFFLAACSPQPPAVIQETPASTLEPTPTPTPTLTPEPTRTPTPTLTPTPQPTPTPVNWEAITPEERVALAPPTYTTENGLVLEKSNYSTLRPDLVFYRGDDGFIRAAYDGKRFLEIPRDIKEVGVLELRYDFGTNGYVSDGEIDFTEEVAVFVPDIPSDATPEQVDEAKVKALRDAFIWMINRGTPLGFKGTFGAIAFDKWYSSRKDRSVHWPSPEDKVGLDPLPRKSGTGMLAGIRVFDSKGNEVGFLNYSYGTVIATDDAYPPDPLLIIFFPLDKYWKEGGDDNKERKWERQDYGGVIVVGVTSDEFEELVVDKMGKLTIEVVPTIYP